MTGYIGEIGSAQERHLPPSHSQPKIGTLSYALIGVKQRGQREPGATIESPSGMREMHTFRKLPITIPKRKKKKMTTFALCHSGSGASRNAAARVSHG